MQLRQSYKVEKKITKKNSKPKSMTKTMLWIERWRFCCLCDYLRRERVVLVLSFSYYVTKTLSLGVNKVDGMLHNAHSWTFSLSIVTIILHALRLLCNYWLRVYVILMFRSGRVAICTKFPPLEIRFNMESYKFASGRKLLQFRSKTKISKKFILIPTRVKIEIVASFF